MPRNIMVALIILSAALQAGCQSAGLQNATVQERDLDQRSVMLLERATRDEAPVVAANAIEALVKVAPESGSPQFRAALDSPSPLVRFAACIAIGDTKDRSAVAVIRRLRSDGDPRVRIGASYAAYRCGDTNAGGELSSAMRSHPDEKVRADAAWLIGRLGDRRAVRHLKAAAQSEQTAYVMAYIHGAMARLGDDAMIERLIQYTLKSDSITRLVSLQMLVELGEPRARRALLYRLGDQSDFIQTRLLAARALGRIGSAEGYGLASTSLIETRSDAVEQMTIRTNAALALGAIGDRRALPALAKVAETDADPQSQVAACCAISMIVRGVNRR